MAATTAGVLVLAVTYAAFQASITMVRLSAGADTPRGTQGEDGPPGPAGARLARSQIAVTLEEVVALPSLGGILALSLLLYFLLARVRPDWGIPDSVNVLVIIVLLGSLAIHSLYLVVVALRHTCLGVGLGRRGGTGKL